MSIDRSELISDVVDMARRWHGVTITDGQASSWVAYALGVFDPHRLFATAGRIPRPLAASVVVHMSQWMGHMSRWTETDEDFVRAFLASRGAR